jgi:glutathione S-transferase
MDLYYSPFACSLAARVVCLEGGLPVNLRRIDLSTKRVEGQRDGAFLGVNPLGKVPALVCDDGHVLTENVAVLLFLGDQAPVALGLAPRESPARYELLRWLSFVATELHKRVLAPTFAVEGAPPPVRQFAREGAAQPLSVLEEHLRDRPALLGGSFTVADAYLAWTLLLLPRPRCGVPLDAFPAVQAYAERSWQREAFAAVLRAEYAEYNQPGWWTASRLEDR